MRYQGAGHSNLWMGVIVAAAILSSFALACGMPFAALGALAAVTLVPRDAVVLAVLGWLANQAVGFSFLGYPLDAMTLAWGVALGLSAVSAVAAGLVIVQMARHAGPLLRLPLVFLAAWVGQQGTVLAASLVLGGTASAFGPAVVWSIFWTNAVVFVALLSAQAFGALLGVARRPMAQPAG